MSRNEHPLRLPLVGTNMDVSGLFGIERGSDGLLRACGPLGHRARIGLRDDMAHCLASRYQPDGDELAEMLACGDQDDALIEAFRFLVTWDAVAPGQIQSAFFRDHPEIPTLRLPGVARVECLQDGLFRMVDEVTEEASTTGISADLTAEIIASWGGLSAAAEHAREYAPVGSIAEILCERWDFEAAIRKNADSNGPPRRLEQRRKVDHSAELLRCLKWAHSFALGCHDADRNLHNPVFKRWLVDCAEVMATIESETAASTNKVQQIPR